MRRYFRNLLDTPHEFRELLIRNGGRRRIERPSASVFANLFLHIFLTRMHSLPLHIRATLGLGLISLALSSAFAISFVT